MGTKIILIIIGSIIWSLTMIRSGWSYDYGKGFWGANGHDSVWHIALTESISRGSLENPVFSGSIIKNYHIGFDVFLAVIHKTTGIQIDTLYFQIIPPILAILIGILTYKFVLLWRKSKSEAFWATFFVYFSGSFGFLVTFLRGDGVTGESAFWASQALSTLVNPPFALSLVFILLGLISLQKKKLLLSILFFGVLIQIKAYAAVLVLSGLFMASLYEFITTHRLFFIKVFFGSLLINFFLYGLIKNDSLSVFTWQPFWFLETMMSYSDRLGWEKFYSAMTTYKMGGIWLKALLAYGVAFFIFVIGNMGLRVLGFYYLCKVLTKKINTNWIIIFITTILGVSVFIPMFFVQKGTPWNTIQFFYYYLFFFAILGGIVASWISNKFIITFITFAVFSSWMTLQHYLPKMPQAKISSNEIKALEFLRRLPDGVVLTYPFDFDKAKQAKAPRPLYLYESTSYVSAFGKKNVYLEDEVNLNIMGYDWKNRKSKVFEFILNLDSEKGKEFLKINNIKYLYLVKNASPLVGEQLKLGPTELGLEELFENEEIIIYEYE
jgi:hypothetical protein